MKNYSFKCVFIAISPTYEVPNLLIAIESQFSEYTFQRLPTKLRISHRQTDIVYDNTQCCAKYSNFLLE